MDAITIDTQTPPTIIYTCYSPANGAKAESCIVSGYIATDGAFVLVGIDSAYVNSEQAERILLRTHHDRLLQHSMFFLTRFIFIPENNLATIKFCIHDANRVELFFTDETRAGIATTRDSLQKYQTALLTRLTKTDSLRVERSVFTYPFSPSVMDLFNRLEAKASYEDVLQNPIAVTLGMAMHVGDWIQKDAKELKTKISKVNFF